MKSNEVDFFHVIPRVIVAITFTACVMYWCGYWLLGCAANQAHVQNEIESTQAGGDYGACTAKVLADGGTQRDWQKCACEVDAFHHVDSGKCNP